MFSREVPNLPIKGPDDLDDLIRIERHTRAFVGVGEDDFVPSVHLPFVQEMAEFYVANCTPSKLTHRVVYDVGDEKVKKISRRKGKGTLVIKTRKTTKVPTEVRIDYHGGQEGDVVIDEISRSEKLPPDEHTTAMALHGFPAPNIRIRTLYRAPKEKTQ